MENIEELRAGADWLSMSVSHDDPYNANWRLKGYECLEEISKEGYELKERALLGYTGLASGNNFVGARDDGSFMQFTGPSADRCYNRTYHPRANITRLDVQVTCRWSVMPLDIGKNALESSTNANSDLPPTRRRRITHITNSDGGETVYIGAPTSDQRGRIYNKEKQSEDMAYTRCWRYEVTFKGDKARRIYDMLIGSAQTRRYRAAGIVGDWFGVRGVQCPWSMDTDIVPMELTTEVPSDYKRTLDWLRKGVRPALYKLARAGYTEQALEAIGIPYLADLP